MIINHCLTMGSYGDANDKKRLDLGGGSAYSIVPLVFVKPRSL